MADRKDLFWAAWKGDIQKVRTLLAKGIQVNSHDKVSVFLSNLARLILCRLISYSGISWRYFFDQTVKNQAEIIKTVA